MRKSILLFGLLVFLLCGLFPPWLDVYSGGHTRYSGYGFILSAPREKRFQETLQWNDRTQSHVLIPIPGVGDRIDVLRLGVEWLCVLSLTGMAWLLADRRKLPHP